MATPARTTIRMGASHYDVTVKFPDSSHHVDLAKAVREANIAAHKKAATDAKAPMSGGQATKYFLKKVASTICQVHGIKARTERTFGQARAA